MERDEDSGILRIIMVVYLGLLLGAISDENVMISVRNIKKEADDEEIRIYMCIFAEKRDYDAG